MYLNNINLRNNFQLKMCVVPLGICTCGAKDVSTCCYYCHDYYYWYYFNYYYYYRNFKLFNCIVFFAYMHICMYACNYVCIYVCYIFYVTYFITISIQRRATKMILELRDLRRLRRDQIEVFKMGMKILVEICFSHSRKDMR